MLDDPIRKLSLDTVRIVADVLSTRSLTQVAQRSGISQPAVSLHIRRFEEAANLEVLRRVGNELMPSVHAEHVLHACQEILRSATQISDYSRLHAERRRGLGVDHEIFALLEQRTQELPRLMREYLLVVDSSDRLIKRFADAQVDAVIRPLYTLEARPDLAFEVPYRWIGAVNATSPAAKSPAGATMPVLLHPRETPYGSVARTYLINHAGNYDVVAETGERATLCSLVQRGLGYAYVPEFAVSAYRGELDCDLPPALRGGEVGSFGVFYHKSAFSFPEAEALLAKVAAACKSATLQEQIWAAEGPNDYEGGRVELTLSK